jgi:hypothetical protein
MGRIRIEIGVDERRCWALFDSGSRNSYVTPEIAQHLVAQELPQPRSTALGGKTHKVTKTCILVADVEGHSIDTHARVIDQIGVDEEGRPIEVLIGALAMQEWGIRLDLPSEKLDFSHYTTDFVEF